MRQGNTASGLPRRRRAEDPMASYDRLPPALRHWLAQAALPWSPRSASALWRRLAAQIGKDPAAILGRLSEIEARMLSRDRYAISAKTRAP